MYADTSRPTDFVCCFSSQPADGRHCPRTDNLSAYSTWTNRGHSQALYAGTCPRTFYLNVDEAQEKCCKSTSGQQPNACQDRLISEVPRSNTQGLSSHRPLLDNKQKSQEKDIHAPAGFEPAANGRRPSPQTARPQGSAQLNLSF